MNYTVKDENNPFYSNSNHQESQIIPGSASKLLQAIHLNESKLLSKTLSSSASSASLSSNITVFVGKSSASNSPNMNSLQAPGASSAGQSAIQDFQ